MSQSRLSVVIGRRAAQQIEDAAEWWRVNRGASPGAVATDLGRALDLIAAQPGIGVPTTSLRLLGVRRVCLVRLGYFLYYRVVPEANELQVLAFWHARRGSRPKL